MVGTVAAWLAVAKRRRGVKAIQLIAVERYDQRRLGAPRQGDGLGGAGVGVGVGEHLFSSTQ